MISGQVLENCITEAGKISGLELCLYDPDAKLIASTKKMKDLQKGEVAQFLDGSDDEAEKNGIYYVKIKEDSEVMYVLLSSGGEKESVFARLTAAQVKNLTLAYREQTGDDSFYQNLLLDNLLLVDIHNKAQEIGIDEMAKRCVYIIEPVGTHDSDLAGMVKELFSSDPGAYVTAVDIDHVIVIRELEDETEEDDVKETAEMLVDMAGSEAVADVRVAYGTVAEDIKSVPASYREAKLSLDVGRIFYPQMRIIDYAKLGVGRLIYQLPVGLCRLFVKEIFGDEIPDEIDEEVLTTVNRFFENSLNVSETSRQLFIHRNTLIYRLDKLQKATGLDVRVFDDALTLKIALMVVNYMKYAGNSKDTQS